MHFQISASTSCQFLPSPKTIFSKTLFHVLDGFLVDIQKKMNGGKKNPQKLHRREIALHLQAQCSCSVPVMRMQMVWADPDMACAGGATMLVMAAGAMELEFG